MGAAIAQPDLARPFPVHGARALLQGIGAALDLRGFDLRRIAAAVDADIAQFLGALAQALHLAQGFFALRLSG
jgi:hypothetical protein